MRHLISTLLLSLLLTIAISCSGQDDAKAGRSEALLYEAEQLISSRDFSKSEEKANEAMEKLNALLDSNPENINYLLLRARAFFLTFQSKNILIMENAPENPNNLTRLPELWEYIDFQQTVTKAQEDLKKALGHSDNISPAQEAAARSILAATYMLDSSTAHLADQHYSVAIEVSEKELKKLNAIRKGQRPKFKINNLERYIEVLEIGRIEANLLKEDWKRSLLLLENMVAGNDLKYFPVQFTLIENRMTELREKWQTSLEHSKDSRGTKLLNYLNKTKKDKSGDSEPTGSSLFQAEIQQLEGQLTTLKNNLIYRILCYRALGDQKNLLEARNTIKSYYPKIDENLENSFSKTK
jgi:hypothetical protein